MTRYIPNQLLHWHLDQDQAMTDTITTVTLPLAVFVTHYRPESWGRNEDWAAHTLRLWADEPEWMTKLTEIMRTDGWIHGPATVHDRVVQNGHHRIAALLMLGTGNVPHVILP